MNTPSAAQALETLIHEYGKLVFHTIYGLTGDWEESQDLTQDTFQQALKGIEAAQAASGVHFHARAWLLRIALNTVRMQRRRHNIFSFIPFSHIWEEREQREYEPGPDRPDQQAAPVQPAGYGTYADDDPADLVAERDAVQRAMLKLPEGLRVCLLLSVVGGLSSMEIARLLSLKEAAVRQRLARARKQFAAAYSHESGEDIFDDNKQLDVQTQQSHAGSPVADQPYRLSLSPRPRIS